MALSTQYVTITESLFLAPYEGQQASIASYFRWHFLLNMWPLEKAFFLAPYEGQQASIASYFFFISNNKHYNEQHKGQGYILYIAGLYFHQVPFIINKSFPP